MYFNGKAYTSLWYQSDKHQVAIIDQTQLPHHFHIATLKTLDDFCNAIRQMKVRGAPLIGATAAFGLAIALSDDASATNEQHAAQQLLATRPTAVNLQWAINRVRAAIAPLSPQQKGDAALAEAEAIRHEDIQINNAIGEYGVNLLAKRHQQQSHLNKPLNILTHCNAGWLATIDWGTALAPIYKAHQRNIPIHVWVDETRPRNQGASLTAWELQQQGIKHTVIADNTGGHLMQHGQVDLCLVGSDRTTASGDVCNKIGTYLKALAAADNGIDFYVALPTSTFDWSIHDGLREIEIEQRNSREVAAIKGLDDNGNIREVALLANSPAANYAFDVTPARLVTGLITEHGLFAANRASLDTLKRQISTTGTTYESR